MKTDLHYLIVLIIGVFLTGCTADKNADAFIGEWQNTKAPNEIWKIEKVMSGYQGTRTGAADFFKTDTEKWKVNNDQKVVRLAPKSSKGSTLTYFPDKDQIMRHPPGIIYQRVAR